MELLWKNTKLYNKKIQYKKKNILVIKFDDLKKNNLKKLFNYLDVEEIKIDLSKKKIHLILKL